MCRDKTGSRFFPSTGTAFALTWINSGVQPAWRGLSLRCRWATWVQRRCPRPPARGTWPSVGPGEGSWGPSYRLEAPSTAAVPSGRGSRALPQGLPRTWRRTSQEGRETAAEPTAYTSTLARHPPKRRASPQGALGGLCGREILPGTARAGGEGAPRPGSLPLLPPRTLAVPTPTSVTGQSGVVAEPPGVVLWTGASSPSVSKRSARHGNLSEGSAR